MLIFFSPAISLFKMLPFLIALQLCLLLEPRWDTWVVPGTAGSPLLHQRMLRSEVGDCHVRGKHSFTCPGNLLPSDFMFSGAWTHLIMNLLCLGHFGM